MRRYKWIAFVIGCLALLSVIGIAIARQGEARYLFATRIILTILGLAAAFLLIAGILNADRERWVRLLLFAILLIGFSAIAIFSIGLFIAPIASILFAVASWKLVRLKSRV